MNGWASKLRTILADGESPFLERLRRMLGEHEELEIIGECLNGAATIEAVHRLGPDLLFLDVQIPLGDGFEVIRQLGKTTPPAVVFVSNSETDAVRAFEARALDYIIKPSSVERLAQTVSRAREQLRTRAAADLAQRRLENPYSGGMARSVRRIAVRAGARTHFVPVDEIDWVEAHGNYVIIHVENERYIIRETLGCLKAQLPSGSFLRVGRSAVVNLHCIKELQVLPHGEHVAVLRGGQQIPLPRGCRELEERLRFL